MYVCMHSTFHTIIIIIYNAALLIKLGIPRSRVYMYRGLLMFTLLGGHLLSLLEFLSKGGGDTVVSETKLKGRDGARVISRIVPGCPHPTIVPLIVVLCMA